MLASSLVMSQAQRLYRKLCSSCKRETEIPLDTLRANRLDAEKFEGVTFYGPTGCPKCGKLGYKGRGAIMEILLISDPIRQMILDNRDAAAIRVQAVKENMSTLLDVGLDRVRDGITSIEEAIRVAGTAE
jgi:type II secretory ATPase GspE/PulE/Tfp pilus assembly ATPase PilB-like protein